MTIMINKSRMNRRNHLKENHKDKEQMMIVTSRKHGQKDKDNTQ